MSNKIYYVGFYDKYDNRVSSLAAVNKMNYINKKIKELGYETIIVSPSWLKKTSNTKFCFSKKNRSYNSNEMNIIFSPSFRAKTKLGNYINILISLTWLFFYLIINVKKSDKVLLYHVPWLSIPIRFSKKIKKFKLILEVEEIYQDISIPFNKFRIWEDNLILSADKFIFSTDLLNKKVNSDKQFCILYGDYSIPRIDENFKICKDQIKLVYAGIIDSNKKGAFNAIEAAKYLNDKYTLHIVGFGEVNKLLKEIQLHNKTFDCKIYYDGILSGYQYIDYMSKMDIGLSTQIVDGAYLESSFPSKILSYLGLGLSVVSGNIDAVKNSGIGDMVDYYHGNNPKNIAQSIKQVNLEDKFNSREKLLDLDKDFKECLSIILK